jgi:hypothetical protein
MSTPSTNQPDSKPYDEDMEKDCRLSTGSGIVCGFTWRIDEDCTLKVCGGQGVTSDGTVICASEKKYHFTHYQSIDAPDYPLFYPGKAANLHVWELFQGRPVGNNDVRPLTPQNEREERQLFLEDKVLLIYLDDEQNSSLRWLLIRQIDLIRYLGAEERLIQVMNRKPSDHDYVYSEKFSDADEAVHEIDIYRSLDRRLDLPEISLRRLGYGCLDPFDCTEEDLEKGMAKFSTLDELYQQYVCVIDAATKELDRGIRQLQSWLVAEFYCHESPEWLEWIDLLCDKWESFKALNKAQKKAQNKAQDTKIHRKEHVQYFYDWCRDLIMAYHELRQAALRRNTECRPAPDAFPRHLSLGTVMRPSLSWFPAALRHEYRQPPIYNSAAKVEEEIRHDHLRLLLMIHGFYLPDSLPDNAVNPYCDVEDDDELPTMNEVRVTPGRYYDQPLGEQSVPYYYPLTVGRFSVHRFWDAYCSRSLTIDRHRSYHARKAGDSYSQLPQATHPLRFNIDRDDFFRIEGHVGHQLADVVTTLNKLRQKWNLPFLVKKYALAEIIETVEETIETGTEEETITVTSFHFREELLGAEHLAGVRPHGTFVLLTEVRNEMEVVVGDLSLPYRCCEELPTENEVEGVVMVELSGQLMACQMEHTKDPIIDLTGVTITDTLNPSATIIIADNSFTYEVVAESSVNLRFSKTGLETVEKPIAEVNNANANLGAIELRPVLVRLYGTASYSSYPANEAAVRLYENETLLQETITNADGYYEFSGVARSATELVVSDDGSVTRALNLVEVCSSSEVNADFSNSNRLVPPRTNEGIIEKHGEKQDLKKDSDRYKKAQEHFIGRNRTHASELYEELNKYGLSVENSQKFDANLRALVENKDLTLTSIQQKFKASLGILANERKLAKPEQLASLAAITKNATLIYLDRVALEKPEAITAGTEKALKTVAESGTKLNVTTLVKEWAAASTGIVEKPFLNSLERFQF